MGTKPETIARARLGFGILAVTHLLFGLFLLLAWVGVFLWQSTPDNALITAVNAGRWLVLLGAYAATGVGLALIWSLVPTTAYRVLMGLAVVDAWVGAGMVFVGAVPPVAWQLLSYAILCAPLLFLARRARSGGMVAAVWGFGVLGVIHKLFFVFAPDGPWSRWMFAEFCAVLAVACVTSLFFGLWRFERLGATASSYER